MTNVATFFLCLRVWQVLWLLLGEMNQSNEESNPQNKTKTSDLPTDQEKQQKGTEGSRQDLQFSTVPSALSQQHKFTSLINRLKDPQTGYSTCVIWHWNCSDQSHWVIIPIHFVTCRVQRDLTCVEQDIVTDKPSHGVVLVELVGWCYYKSEMLTSPKES